MIEVSSRFSSLPSSDLPDEATCLRLRLATVAFFLSVVVLILGTVVFFLDTVRGGFTKKKNILPQHKNSFTMYVHLLTFGTDHLF